MAASAPLRRWRSNLAAFALGNLLLLALLEGVIFRFVLPGTDLPVNEFHDGVVRYRPHQTGIFRVRNEVAAPFRINANGWNSAHDRYLGERVEGKRRIAIIGDSYVEALHVPYDRSLAEQLERALGPEHNEVYRFGMSGAPLSQYLHMLEQEVLAYRPDVVVVVVVHNDLVESYRLREGRYTSSFLRVRVEEGRVVADLPPEPYEPDRWDWLRRSATSRFFYYRWGLRAAVRALDPARYGPRFEANIDVSQLDPKLADLRTVTAHLLQRLRDSAARASARLLVVMDGVRWIVYEPQPADRERESAALKLNRVVAEACQRLDIEHVDLHAAFRSAHQASGQRFEFARDNHWNEHGHSVASSAIAQRL